MNYKLLLLILAMGFVLFPFSNSYAAKISCAADIDLDKYPICNYVTEWNESEEFNEKLLAELAIHVEQINDNPDEFSQIYQAVVDKINRDYPGLQEKCQKIKDQIYEWIQNT